MNKSFLLTAFNAVYFGFAVIGCAWFLVTYGLGFNAAVLIGAAAVCYFSLCVAALLEPFLRRTLAHGPYPSPRVAKSARMACLVIPLFAWGYIASFYLLQNTFCTPGGVWRCKTFHGMEVFLFGKAKCLALIPGAVQQQLDSYLDDVFTPWANSHFLPPCVRGFNRCRCSFNVEKSGAIRESVIAEASDYIDFDKAALIVLDGTAPPLPKGAPDYVSIDFTFDHHGCAGINWSDWPKIKYPMAEELIRRARACIHFENYPEAKVFLLECLDCRRAQFGNCDPSLIPVLMQLGDLAFTMRLHNQADPYFEEALAIAQRDKRRDKWWYAEVLWRYAESAYNRMQYAKAADLYARYKSVVSPELINRTFDICYAQSLYGGGDHNAATAKFASILKQDEKTFGSRNSYMLDDERLAMCNLYIDQGAQQKTVPLLNSLLTKSKGKVDKSSKMERLSILRRVADIYERLKDRKSQQRVLEKTLSESVAAFGPLAPESTRSRSDLADVLWLRDRKSEAIDLFEKLVAGYSELNPDRANALFHQAAFHYGKGRFGDAEKSLQKALTIRCKFYGEADDRTNTVKFALATVLEEMKKFAQAKTVVSSAVVSKAFSPVDIACASASCYENLGNASKAFEIYESLLRELRKSDQKVYEADTVYRYLIDLSRVQHDDLRMERYLKEQFELDFKHGTEPSRFELIEFYLERKQFAKAEELCNLEVTGIDLDEHGHSAPKVQKLAKSFVLLAKVLYMQQRMQPAKYYLSRALSLLEPYGRCAQHIETAGLLANLLADEGDLEGAEKVLESVLNGELSSTADDYAHNPVQGFYQLCNSGTQTVHSYSYVNPDKSEREDPTIIPNIELVENDKAPVPMVDMYWSPGSSYRDVRFLKIATLAALASIQERMSAKDDCTVKRSRLLDLAEKDVIESLSNNDYWSCEGYEALIKKLPPSARREEILLKIQKLSSIQ